MNNNTRQTVKKEKIGLLKIVGIIIGSIILMDRTIAVLNVYGGIVSTIAGLAVVAMGGLVCMRLIYNNLAVYSYKVIIDELILERSIGRGNHLVVSIKFSDVKAFEKCSESYDSKSLAKIQKFAISKAIKDWYMLSYMRDGELRKIIIEPNEGFIGTLENNIK